MARTKKYNTEEERLAAKREINKRYRERNKEAVIKTRKKYYDANKDKIIQSELDKYHNFTPEQKAERALKSSIRRQEEKEIKFNKLVDSIIEFCELKENENGKEDL